MVQISKIWISWETQRRSVELAKHLGCKLYIFDYCGFTRYVKSIWRTLKVLRQERPALLFVQNPSMVLAAFACCYCALFSTRLIVDRHTTFMLTRKYRQTPSVILFKILHKFTIKFADLTIVTNDFLAEIVNNLGGRAFVLPDKLPGIVAEKPVMDLVGERNILLISSFGKDEPIFEVLEAMRNIADKECHLYITGNYKKLREDLPDIAPENVSFTGFMPEEEFLTMLVSVDIVMALTTSDYCMLCGCYEAVAVEKPLITSDKKELRDYFTEAVFVDNSSEGIAEGIDMTLTKLSFYNEKISVLNKKIDEEWDLMFAELEKTLYSLV